MFRSELFIEYTAFNHRKLRTNGIGRQNRASISLVQRTMPFMKKKKEEHEGVYVLEYEGAGLAASETCLTKFCLIGAHVSDRNGVRRSTRT